MAARSGSGGATRLRSSRERRRGRGQGAGPARRGTGRTGEGEGGVYIPGRAPPPGPGEEMVVDTSAYRLLHHAGTGAPCLSLDIVRDGLGDDRETLPLSLLLCAGTQAPTAQGNRLMVLKMQNLYGPRRRRGDSGSDSDSDSSEEEEEEEDEERSPQLHLAMIPHYGGINRVRVLPHGAPQICGADSRRPHSAPIDAWGGAIEAPLRLSVILHCGGVNRVWVLPHGAPQMCGADP
ncbi:glutamate-rich WD repeat-containing protein 1 [Numida meleagris]|uniref:glutamate-rich WD repeat-containing protein 1 n=1 Tax=Numida meleagris TaxID=8996 RepID=UPI000B3DCB71|nr:glutamate-rich WD repeat-containing protein 1 [Numida meleagris]